MANNYKDNNADLGNQTIEGTQPPYEVDAEIVSPDAASEAIIMTPPPPQDDPIIMTPPPSEPAREEPIIMAPPPESNAADMEAQLAAMLNDEPTPPINDTTAGS